MILCQRKGWYFVDPRSLNALCKLYEWRDRIGRKLDQSLEAVMSNKLLKRIVVDLPQTADQLLDSNKYHLSVVAYKYHQDIVDLIQQAIHTSQEESIDPVFEASANGNGEAQTEGTPDLNALCCSTAGCFDDVVDELDLELDGALTVEEMKSLKVSKLDMISKNDSKSGSGSNTKSGSGSTSFFVRTESTESADTEMSEINEDHKTQEIANEIFKEIAEEPILKLIRRQQNVKGLKGQENGKRSRTRTRTKRKNELKTGSEKLVRNQVPTKKKVQKAFKLMATANSRHKLIAGSKYSNKHAGGNVFKLPRELEQLMPKKRKKRKGGDEDGPTLMATMPSKRRKVEEKPLTEKQRIKKMEQWKRGKKMNAVEDMWPFDKDGRSKDRWEGNFGYEGHREVMEENVGGDEDVAGTTEKKRNGDDGDGEGGKGKMMTEAELLDKAPIPVLDTPFDDHYSPFRSNKQK